MTEVDAYERAMRDHRLTALFVAARLGPRPRRIAEQDAAVKRAADELDVLDTDEARAARRILAIEYRALVGHRSPSVDDWEAAIIEVDRAADADVRMMMRGGMSLRASSGGWARGTTAIDA